MKNNTKNSVLKSITAVLFAMMIASILVIGASANDVDSGTEAPEHPAPPAPQSPTSEQTIDNGDGTYTFTQQVDEASTPPHYYGPWGGSGGYGFEEYSWYDEDYGWQHTFPSFNTANLQILSATLTIRAWDVDSEVSHGWDGEYDGVTADSVSLSPQYLQGNDEQWSVTTFTLPNSVITDDGDINIWLDIDMHHDYDYWATTVDYSKLTIVYTIIDTDPPYQPALSISPSPCVAANDDLVVTVTGPTPPDPDGDSVTYTYRWMVDTGTGFYVDDDFAGRGDHTGNSVPGSDTVVGDKWMVQVTPFDVHGVQGDYAEVFWSPIVLTCNIPPVANAGPDQTVEQTYYQGASVTLDGSGSSDPDGDPLTYKWTWTGGSTTGVSPTISLPLGTTTITLLVNDGTVDSAPDTVIITVQDTTAPVITCPADVTVEQESAAGTVVPLTATATDICDADPTITSNELAIYPLGTTTVTFTATDDSGNSAICTTMVTVIDTTPPEMILSDEQIVLWSPNHKYRTVEIADCCVISVTDICDADVNIDDVVITSVSSDEPENDPGTGDGNTVNDIIIKDSQTVDLRAERQGNGNGRVYTINFEVTDASGNTQTGSCTVWVVHDQMPNDIAIDDGASAGYTVYYP